MTTDINLDFRPKSYFKPQAVERYLLSKVKNAELRATLQRLFNEGRYAEAMAILGESGVSEEAQKALGAIHPALMGGNYLPDTQTSEVEIARIRIDSSTQDVTSVYAKAGSGRIRYRVVDEYGGETLSSPSKRTSKEPLTLGELAEFFLKAWPLMGVLAMNQLGLDEALMWLC